MNNNNNNRIAKFIDSKELSEFISNNFKLSDLPAEMINCLFEAEVASVKLNRWVKALHDQDKNKTNEPD